MNSTRFTVYRLSALELKKKAELADSLDSYVALTDELIVNLHPQMIVFRCSEERSSPHEEEEGQEVLPLS
ncbi:hypothetical protein EMCRGX_G032877 [Ephydatia muelleri]